MIPSVAAVIPTYRPPAATLLLVRSLVNEGLAVAVVDDASPCTSDRVLSEFAGMPSVTVLRNDRNAGIARSLNQGLAWAHQAGASWILAVDQDSSLAPGYPSALLDAATDPRIGVIGAEVIADLSGDLRYPARWQAGLLVTEEVFQTGSMWSVAALQSVGGFDESLGMDAVDAAACLRLRGAGYLVTLAPGTRLSHRVGEARQVNLFGRQVVVSNHGADRRGGILRNRLRLAPAEFRQSPVHAFRTVRRVLVQSTLAVTVEDNRLAKVTAMARAVIRPAPNPRRTRHPASAR